MPGMPRPRPPYLQREINRHGTVVWYVRKGGIGPRIRVRGEYGSQEFSANYAAALSGTPVAAAPRTVSDKASLAWLVTRYRETDAWRNLSDATRYQRENILKHILKAAGHQPFADIDRGVITDGRDRRGETPTASRHFLDTMRGLFRWAYEAKHVAEDPTVGISNPALKKSHGFPAWNEEDVVKYETRWPRGTRQRVWLDVILYLGLRRGDSVLVGRQHVRDGVITLRTEKSQEQTTVTLPILPPLAETLKAGPCGQLTFICGANGRPLTKESFGNDFRDACEAAGVSKRAHGIRKIAATRAAEAGATEAQLDAIFGWEGGRMAPIYVKAANRRRLAMNAMHMLSGNDSPTSIPAPPQKVRGSAENT